MAAVGEFGSVDKLPLMHTLKAGAALQVSGRRRVGAVAIYEREYLIFSDYLIRTKQILNTKVYPKPFSSIYLKAQKIRLESIAELKISRE